MLGRYLAGMSRFPQLAIRGCATRSADHARAAATRYGIGHYDTVPEMLAAPDVEVVLNITPVAEAEGLLLGAAPDIFLGSAGQTARGRIGEPVRTATSPSRRVESITVTTPTHVCAVLEFRSGVIGTLVASYDVWDHHLPWLEVYGTQGTLSLPAPNTYDGDVLLKRHTDDEWQVLPPVTPQRWPSRSVIGQPPKVQAVTLRAGTSSFSCSTPSRLYR